jgi:hypothetical protein
MAYTTIEIDKYRVAVFPQTGTPAKITFWNSSGNRFAVAYLRPEGEELPEAYEDVDQGHYRLYFCRSVLPELVDLLRHEGPMFVHFWEGAGNNTHIATGREPVGEDET